MWTMPRGLNLRNFLYYLYPSATGNNGVGLIPIVLFIVTLPLMKKNKNTLYLFASLSTLYVTLTYINDKAEKYFAYAYPFILIILVGAISSIRNKLYRDSLFVVLILSIVINFLCVQLRSNTSGSLPIQIGNYVRLRVLPGYLTYFNNFPWPTKEIVSEFLTESNCKHGVLVFPDHYFINANNVGYLTKIQGKDIVVQSALSFYNPAVNDTFNINYIKRYDCVLSKTKNSGSFSNQLAIDKVNEELLKSPNFVTKKFYAPDDSVVLLFIRQ